MPAELPDDSQRAILEGTGIDYVVCRECGAAVARVAPRRLRSVSRVMRQRPCAEHAEVVGNFATPDRLPEFVKQMTWDLGLNLLAYSESINPQRFNPAQANRRVRPCGGAISTRSPNSRGMRRPAHT